MNKYHIVSRDCSGVPEVINADEVVAEIGVYKFLGEDRQVVALLSKDEVLSIVTGAATKESESATELSAGADVEVETYGYDDLRTWIKATSKFPMLEKITKSDLKADRWRFELHSISSWYKLIAHPRSIARPNGYLGCIVHSHAGGSRDLADGYLTEGTWKRIVAEIMAKELICLPTE